MDASEPKQRLTVHLAAPLRSRIETEAKSAGQTLSTWVERALMAFLQPKAGK